MSKLELAYKSITDLSN